MRAVAIAFALGMASLLSGSSPAAGQYDCNDPQVRAAYAYARQAMAQSIAVYEQMPPSIRQQMDASARQQTGYSFVQLAQLASECSGGGRVAPVAPVAPVRPVAPVQPVAPVRPGDVAPAPRVLSPAQYRLLLPRLPRATFDTRRLDSSLAQTNEAAVLRAQGGPFAAVPLAPAGPQDGVPIGGLHLSLCWQLYHRTDCSDAQAAASYQKNAQLTLDDLAAKQQAADRDVATLEHRLQLFHDAERQQDTTKLVASMRADNEEFMAVRNDALKDATFGLATLATHTDEAALYLHDVPVAAALLGRHAATGERFDPLDRESLAETLTGVGTSAIEHGAAYVDVMNVAEAASGIGTGVTIGMSALRIAGAVALDYEVRKIDRAITEPQQRLAEYGSDLEGRLAMARARQRQVAADIAGQKRMLAEVAAYAKP